MKSPRMAPAFGDVRNRQDAVLKWTQWYESLDLKGTRGGTLEKLFAGLFLKATKAQTLYIGFSVREAAEMGGMSTSTALTMMKRGGAVEVSGYLKAVNRSKAGFTSNKSTTWKPILKHEKSRQEPSSMVMHPTVAINRASPASNVMHGKTTAWRIYCRLSHEEVTVSSLAAALGLTPETIRNNLRYLADNGLAERIDRFAWRGVDRDLNELPDPDGVDHAARKRERHNRERADFHMKREARAAWEKEREAALARAIALHRAERTRRKKDRASLEETDPLYDLATGEILEMVGAGAGGVP
jgi:DNA-binding transcriptional ArsR family regulator